MPFWEDGRNVPNMLQFTQIEPKESLGTHWDSRNKWLEGILSIGFGSKGGANDERGDNWNLILEKGAPIYEQKVVSCTPGTAYIIFGSAQGRTEHCKENKVMHETCQCCWKHGINSDKGIESTRLSLTLRVYDNNWGTVSRICATKIHTDKCYCIFLKCKVFKFK